MVETKTLEYHYADGRHVIFDKYTCDALGIIRNKKNRQKMSYKLDNGYYKACVYDNDGKKCTISIARAVASTFLGKPTSLQHTADHIISNQKLNNDISNIRWVCKTEQVNNRNVPSNQKSAFVIVKDDIELTSKEWEEHLEDVNNSFGRKYTAGMISKYAMRSQHGFSYKEYPDLEGEVWKHIKDSEIPRGDYWEISNKSRVKYVTKHASNILSGERLSLVNGYPSIGINGKTKTCHTLAFEAFYPDEPRDGLMVLHKHDNRLDFSPQNLRLGSASENVKDAYDNGKYKCTKSARKACASYINGILEKEHDSQTDAIKYLWDNGYEKATQTAIAMVLSGDRKSAYGRIWKVI